MIISVSVHNIIIRSVVTMEKVVVFAIMKHKFKIKKLLQDYYLYNILRRTPVAG